MRFLATPAMSNILSYVSKENMGERLHIEPANRSDYHSQFRNTTPPPAIVP